MAKAKRKFGIKRSSKTGRYVTVDGAYVRKQASEAVSTFFAPVSGALKAARHAGEPSETIVIERVKN